MGETTEVGLSLPIILGSVIGMLLLAFSVVIFFVLYQRRLLAQRAEMDRREAEYQRELLESNIQAQEAERKRIAEDLHDSVGSILSAAKLFLNQIKQGSKEEIFLETKKETAGLLDNSIVNIRGITRNLIPPGLEQFGLKAAINDLFTLVRKLNNIEIEFICENDRRFEPDREMNVYRIVQELTNNTLKYAKAQNITLKMDYNEKDLTVRYQDDGIGFEVGKKKEGGRTILKGLGLRSIESRANLLGASLNYDSKPGEGVTVDIVLPLAEIAEAEN